MQLEKAKLNNGTNEIYRSDNRMQNPEGVKKHDAKCRRHFDMQEE